MEREIIIKQYNESTECEVQDGVSPRQILYSGTIDNIPDDLANEIGYKQIWESLTGDGDSVFIYLNP